ncbi:hypothetical protein DEJ23_04405 [Curtobacterium sp. MCSS17_008]|uniref:SdpI family protein n=1 Tax=Curtobacterium sp. MCSS17_008 TaxID=2175647 RepID=UPI000DA9999A|nr:SdpI family protein [Curtobacterium sp. MCSS17_008]PZF58150.1 hypothetical protein DEJ23_04405 [Curtobacterium sp. MCSS17_008]
MTDLHDEVQDWGVAALKRSDWSRGASWHRASSAVIPLMPVVGRTLPVFCWDTTAVTMLGALVFARSLEIGAAALITWLTWRAANGSLPRNGFAGVRTSVTLSSDAAWRIGHRAALRPTIVSAIATVAWCAVSLGVAPLRTPVAVLVAAGLLVGGALLSIPAAHRAVRQSLPES